jgi:hypothetical protein
MKKWKVWIGVVILYALAVSVLIAILLEAAYGAPRYTLKAYLVDTPFQTYRQKQVALARAITIIKVNTGIYLKPTLVRTTRTYLKNLYKRDISCSGDLNYCAYAKQGYNLTLFYFGPDLYEGHIWFAGSAQGVCKLNMGGAKFLGSQKRDNGTSGVKFCAFGIAHELLHLLGAEDKYNTGTLDDTGLFYYIDKGLTPTLSVEGKAEVKECTK